MFYQSEAQLEKNMIEQLMRQGYEKVTIDNYDSLIHNIHDQCDRIFCFV